MKCKNWSNKLNNFVVRKLKSFKINGQQQVLTSTMPAMPKEKQTTPISLEDSNFDEIKMKEQLNISNTSIPSAVSAASSVSRLLRRCSSNNLQQQCCCQLDDCCPIMATSSATGSIQDTTTVATATNDSIIYNSNINNQNSKTSRPHNCLIGNVNCNQHDCSNVNYSNLKSSSTINYCNSHINRTNNLEKSNEVLDYKSSIRDSMNSCNNTILASQLPKTATCSMVLASTSSASYSSSSSSSSTTYVSTTSSSSSYSSPCTSNSIAPIATSKTYCNCNCSSSNRFNNSADQKFENKLLQIENSDRNIKANSTSQSTSYSYTSKINSNSSCSSNYQTKTSSTSNATTSGSSTTIPSTSNSCSQGTPNGVTPQPQTKKTANDFIFEEYLGEGSFSTVYRAKEVRNKKEYAIKVCEKVHIIKEKKQEYVKREREVMHQLRSVPGFVNLYCTFQDETRLYFVMTFAKNGDLLPYINKVGSFDLEVTQHYAAELVLACEEMHKRGIVHRDLKPENILLDENMHSVIADFGSAKIIDPNEQYVSSTCNATTSDTSDSDCSTRKNRYNNHLHNDNENDEAQTRSRRRKCSFVGTAQYVSPELLQNNQITPACDLWALGCIIYQMISGLPPFRGNSEFLIFKQILNLNLEFPEGFDENAEDLVRNLLKLNPDERLGSQDKVGCYESIRTHPFFEGINWDAVRLQKPPTIYPYLPGANNESELRSKYRVPENLEPGLSDKQYTRLLGLSLMGIEVDDKTEPKNNFNLTETEMKNLLEAQKADKWNAFAEGELILKKGFVNKRKGLFARKRMLLLLTGPKLVYIDPVAMVKKGEIPWSPELRVEIKSFKIFFVHTPNRTYYLEDPEGYALKWVSAIENVRQQTYSSQATSN